MLACPCYMYDIEFRYLKHGWKVCYMGHRRWLDNDHEFREDDINFDGTKEFRLAPVTSSGLNIMQQIEKLVGRCLGKKHQAFYKKERGGRKMYVSGRREAFCSPCPFVLIRSCVTISM